MAVFFTLTIVGGLILFALDIFAFRKVNRSISYAAVWTAFGLLLGSLYFVRSVYTFYLAIFVLLIGLFRVKYRKYP